MNKAANKALAVNHAGWTIESYHYDTGWKQFKNASVFQDKGDAILQQAVFADIYRNTSFRVYEALTGNSKQGNIRSLTKWPY